MVDIQSKEVIDKMADELKVQPSMALPRKLVNSIQPTYQVNPPVDIRIISSVLNDVASTVLFTAVAGKRTFLYGGNISVAKDVVSDSIFSSLVGTLVSSPVTSQTLFRLNYEPVTAGNIQGSFVLPHPVELQPTRAIVMNHGTNTASIDGAFQIYISETDVE